MVAALLVLALGAIAIAMLRRSSGPRPDLTPPAAETVITQAPSQPPDWLQSVELKRGDTLVSALTRAGVEARLANEIAQVLSRGGAELKRLMPGNKLEITWGPQGTATAVTWQASAWLGWAAVSEEGGWKVKRFETTPDVRVEAVRGEVQRSLFQAIDDIGESPQLVLSVVAMFESDFDFTADTRSGDRFRLLVEKRYAGDTFVSNGRVLAAQYLSSGRTLTGVGFAQDAKDRFAYYDLDGRSMKKSFLKSPLEFTRITSGFTYARPHPILGGVRPHLAIDYAAPVGTPVRAVADGSVVSAGWDGGNGISIKLRHRSGYETMYNHLSRLGAGVRSGARVAQRQVIGYVGATGLATGPHLDYRVAQNGNFVNPLSEKFIPGEPIPPSERADFQKHARALIARLEADAPF